LWLDARKYGLLRLAGVREEQMKRFGEALGQLLHERGISQAELARRLDITSSAVNLWVNGRAKPSRVNVERIEDELAVDSRGSLLALLGYSRENESQPTPESLIRADPRIAPEDKRVLLRILALARERHTQTQ
jgi:transcriptional regulator with XRE-family HTH domain